MHSVLLILSFVVFSVAETHAQSTLRVKVSGIRKTEGTIRVGLFDNEKDFLKNAIEGKVIKADKNEVTVLFNDLKPGVYAISVIHDENENEKLDTNFLGIPKEGFAFGNNAMRKFGPPSFSEASIQIGNTVLEHHIIIKYF
jgi:uncharacterized protein (DUF2141 family)